MRFVVVTGMSGGGKRTALKMLEDMGFFCVDNLPISLLEKFDCTDSLTSVYTVNCALVVSPVFKTCLHIAHVCATATVFQDCRFCNNSFLWR